mgnify:CR=1 FL=1
MHDKTKDENTKKDVKELLDNYFDFSSLEEE